MKEVVRTKLFIFIFTLPLYTMSISVFGLFLGLPNTDILTLSIYLCLLMYAIIKLGITKNDIFVIIIQWMLIVVSFLFFPNTREYYFSTNMAIVLFFYIPFCSICLRKPIDYSKLQLKSYKILLIALVISIPVYIILLSKEYVSYLTYSYSFLPTLCLSYYVIRLSKKRQPVFILFLLIGMFEILSFTSRGALLSLIFFIIIFEFFGRDIKTCYKILSIVILIFICIIVYLNLQDIINFLLQYDIFSRSKFLTRLATNNLLTSKGRDILYKVCLDRLKTMGFNVLGFFGDRKYVISYAPYPHNFVFEVLMSWGWIIGIVAIIMLLILILRPFVLDIKKRGIIVLLFFSFFARFLLSSSYIQDGYFYIFLFSIIGLNKNLKTHK